MRKFFMLLLSLLLLPALALAQATVIDLVHEPDAPYAFAENSPLLEVFFPRIFGSDACFMRMGDEVIMIDGSTNGQTERIDECIAAAQIDHVDIGFNTHPHADHLPGMVIAAQKIPFSRFIITFEEDYNTEMRRAVRELNDLGLTVEHAADGDVLHLGEATLTVIKRSGPQFTTNDLSALLLVQYGERRLLMAADVENRGQSAVSENPPECGIDCDILKLPHHGLEMPVRPFREAISPQACVLFNNFMDGEISRNYYEARGVPVFSTVYGILRLRTDGEIWVIDYLPGSLTRQPPAYNGVRLKNNP